MAPAALALGLILLFATPMEGGALSFTPNVAWLLSFIVVMHAAPSWPLWLAYAAGLLQDVLHGTPLGTQALVALAVAFVARGMAQRYQSPQFRIRWLEAAGVLVLAHALFWVLLQMTLEYPPHLRGLLRAGLINAMWYPLMYWLVTRSFAALSEAK
jgi:rod shape-determining protein MreD